MSTNLAFFAADTLGTTLYQVEGGLESADIRKFQLGDWRIEVPLTITSDLITPREVTFWLRLGTLPLYLIVRDKECWLFVTTPGTPESITTPATTITNRIADMRARIAAAFVWGEDGWKSVAIPGV